MTDDISSLNQEGTWYHMFHRVSGIEKQFQWWLGLCNPHATKEEVRQVVKDSMGSVPMSSKVNLQIFDDSLSTGKQHTKIHDFGSLIDTLETLCPRLEVYCKQGSSDLVNLTYTNRKKYRQADKYTNANPKHADEVFIGCETSPASLRLGDLRTPSLSHPLFPYFIAWVVLHWPNDKKEDNAAEPQPMLVKLESTYSPRVMSIYHIVEGGSMKRLLKLYCKLRCLETNTSLPRDLLDRIRELTPEEIDTAEECTCRMLRTNDFDSYHDMVEASVNFCSEVKGVLKNAKANIPHAPEAASPAAGNNTQQIRHVPTHTRALDYPCDITQGCDPSPTTTDDPQTAGHIVQEVVVSQPGVQPHLASLDEESHCDAPSTQVGDRYCRDPYSIPWKASTEVQYPTTPSLERETPSL